VRVDCSVVRVLWLLLSYYVGGLVPVGLVLMV